MIPNECKYTKASNKFFIIIIIYSNTFYIPFAAEILDAETVAVVAVVVVVVVAAVAEATLTHTFCGNLVTMKAN